MILPVMLVSLVILDIPPSWTFPVIGGQRKGLEVLRSGYLVKLNVYGIKSNLSDCWLRVSSIESFNLVNYNPARVLVSTLNENEHKYRPQSMFGSHFKAGQFSSFLIKVLSLKLLEITIDFLDSNGQEIGQSVFRHALFEYSSLGSFEARIDAFNSTIGTISIGYLIVKPTKFDRKGHLDTDGQSIWKNLHSHGTVHSGHRGLGGGFKGQDKKYFENTIASFNEAARYGADTVELDVSLTDDQQVVVYHDLELRDVRTNETVAIRSLNYNQILSKNYTSLDNPEVRSLLDDDDLNKRPFPTLRQVLERTPLDLPINVEVKFPVQQKNNVWVPHQLLEINNYVDKVLEQVFEYAGSRDIIFISFDPDICTCLRFKQTNYPVLLITQSRSTMSELKDMRISSLEMALYYASAIDIVGVNVFADDLLADNQIVSNAKAMDLLTFAWDAKLTRDNIAKLTALDVSCVIYDDIDVKLGRRSW